MLELPVALGDRSYNIIIARGILNQSGLLMRNRLGEQKALLVSNPRVFSLYGEQAVGALSVAGFSVTCALMPDGEQYKNMREATRVLNQAVKAGLERSSVVVALGGGVVGDLAGFVAAIYQRGIQLVQVPTTLLSQVDSSVGGKVAVNHTGGKNLIGAFYQPRLVLIDTSTLETLEDAEYRSGLGEVVKYGIAFDENLFEYLETYAALINNRNEHALEFVIMRCCQIKGEVVSVDERETGLRMSLNLGHTVGHALEKKGRYRDYRHGEAVAMGTIVAAIISKHHGLMNEADFLRIKGLYQKLGLPVAFPPHDVHSIYKGMLNDKKISENRLRLVLPVGIGGYTITTDITKSEIIQAIQEAQRI